MLTETISWVEVLWVIAGVISLPVSLINLRQAGLNLAALNTHRVTNAGFRLTARLAVRRERVGVFLQAVLLFAAVRSWFYPSADVTSWDTILVGIGFTLAQLLITLNSVRSQRDQTTLLAFYRKQNKARIMRVNGGNYDRTNV